MLAKFFIERPVLANVIAILTMVLGGVAIFALPVAQYPPITPPTVQVTTRARLTRVTRAQAERVLAQRPELAFQLIQRLVQRVRTLTRTVGRLGSVDVYGRLVGLFDALAVEDKGLRVVPGPLSQQRIAERLGASKAMVNRLLTDLSKGGYIEVSRERIVLLRKLPPKW